MIRVTTGTAKGRRLALPKNHKLTAVKEIVKSAIFSIIGEQITNASCLDLYAGSGNMGIEALSRGAAACDFVDEARAAIETVEKNLQTCRFNEYGTAIQDDSLRFLANTQNLYDLIFADPYYAEPNHKYLMKLGLAKLKPNGVLFLLTSAEQPYPEPPLELADKVELGTRKYGKTLLTMLTSKQ